MAGPPRFRARACRVAPHESNVKVIQSTRAHSKTPGQPRQGSPEFQGRAYAPGGDAGAVIPWFRVEYPLLGPCNKLGVAGAGHNDLIAGAPLNASHFS